MHQILAEALKHNLLPAVVFTDIKEALPVAEAFLNGGLNVMEVPFRTAAAANVITLIRQNFPEMCVGGGTLLSTDALTIAVNAGAQFGLSSGLNTSVGAEAWKLNFPFIPGVMTPSEIETAYNLGYTVQKLFPAEPLGGTTFLKALLGPYGHLAVQFIPMGGVNILNMNTYLALKNVIAIGGSWLATEQLIAERNYSGITKNIKEALLQMER